MAPIYVAKILNIKVSIIYETALIKFEFAIIIV